MYVFQICSGGKCEVKQFPFDTYPDFLEDYLPSFAWKPVVIQVNLKTVPDTFESRIGLWVDR